MATKTLEKQLKDLKLTDTVYQAKDLSTSYQIKSEFDKLSGVSDLNINVVSREEYINLPEKTEGVIYLVDDNDVYMDGCSIHGLKNAISANDAVAFNQLSDYVKKEDLKTILESVTSFKDFKSAILAM